MASAENGQGRGGDMQSAESSSTYDPYCINVWSGPRCLSTTLMYSFAQRADTEVLDEPLYAHWLKVSGAQRPYREQLLQEMETDGNWVVREVIHGPRSKKIMYAKHIAKFWTRELTDEVILRGRHVLLIRDPIDLLPSFDSVLPVSLEETGFPLLVQLWDEMRRKNRSPAIIDAAALRADPQGVLRALCAFLEIPFDEAMLKWESGPRPEDGLWAPWWYSDVHKSTGFQPPPPLPRKPFPEHLYELLEECRPFYSLLSRHALTAQAPARIALPDTRNERILVWVGSGLVPRNSASVSVFDSAVQGGDGVWEGLRIYQNRVFKLEEHLDRLFDSAKAMAFAEVPSRAEVKRAIFATLMANNMRDSAHIRLTLTRGMKVTSGMSPHFNKYGPLLIVLAEWKKPVYNNKDGITLVTSSTRRNSPQCVDSKIHHTNLINNILAKVDGNLRGADDAIMLDPDGFVSETNATNLFMVKRGHVATPHADYCLPGITRATVIEVARLLRLPLVERRISLSEFHSADEVFTTGTMGELSPVRTIDGRLIGDGHVGPITLRLQEAYADLTKSEGVPIPVNA